jgi:hypothetical protein
MPRYSWNRAKVGVKYHSINRPINLDDDLILYIYGASGLGVLLGVSLKTNILQSYKPLKINEFSFNLNW